MADLVRELSTLKFGADLADSLAKIGRIIGERKRQEEADKAVQQVFGQMTGSPESFLRPEVAQLFTGLSMTEEGQRALGGVQTAIGLSREAEQRETQRFRTEITPFERQLADYERNRRLATDKLVLEQQKANLETSRKALMRRYPRQAALIPEISPAEPIRESRFPTPVTQLPPQAAAEIVNKQLQEGGFKTVVKPEDFIKMQARSVGAGTNIETKWWTDDQGKLWRVTYNEATKGQDVAPVTFKDESGKETQLKTNPKGGFTPANLISYSKYLQSRRSQYGRGAITDESQRLEIENEQKFIDDQLKEMYLRGTLSEGDPNKLFEDLQSKYGYTPEEAEQLMLKWGILAQ